MQRHFLDYPELFSQSQEICVEEPENPPLLARCAHLVSHTHQKFASHVTTGTSYL